MSWKFAIFWHTYYCQLGFSSEIEVPQLGLARILHSSGLLEPDKSSSNSSLVCRGVHLFPLWFIKTSTITLNWNRITRLKNNNLKKLTFQLRYRKGCSVLVKNIDSFLQFHTECNPSYFSKEREWPCAMGMLTLKSHFKNNRGAKKKSAVVKK